MSMDIGPILEDWPFEPGQVTVRRIVGRDGREKIQLRLDLGVLQMETTGRPDGQRPHGCESLLDYHEHRLALHVRRHGETQGFELDERACEMLRGEAVMYYHRYLAAFVLEDFEMVQRDTVRNLRLLDLCRAHAKEESDRYVLEQYRPYILMMCTRARAMVALRDSRPKSALAAVRRGIQEIRAFYREFGQAKLIASSGELAVLRALQKEIAGRLPEDPVRRLRQELARAVRDERYEDAAGLRDRIARLTDNRPPARPA